MDIKKELITEIEKKRNSRLIVYFTGDRMPFNARIAEDAVRPMYDHLQHLLFNQEPKILDLFLYSRGGDVSVPWRIVSMAREFCDEFNVLIPYRAQSAATLLSMGADQIVMGKKAELGPIDPTMVKANIGETSVPPQEIAVEDVNSYVSFLKERTGIKNQHALVSLLKSLVTIIGPLALGSVNRQHHHIRLVAEKLLRSRKIAFTNHKIKRIIEILTEKMYSHGHAIGREEAKSIGLPVVFPNTNLEESLWRLYLLYEELLKLNNPLFPEILLKEKENMTLDSFPIAIIESAEKLHVFKMSADLIKKRNVPVNPQININLNLQLPQDVRPEQLSSQMQPLFNQMMQQLTKEIANLVQQEIIRQSPVIGFEGRGYGGRWYEEN